MLRHKATCNWYVIERRQGARERGQRHDAEVKAVLIKQGGISEPFKPH